MTYEKASGGVWEGLLADGTVDMAEVAQKYASHYGHEMKTDPHAAVADMLFNLHKQYRGKTPSPGGLYCCKWDSDSVFRSPICETYVLSVNNRRKQSSVIYSKSYVSAILEELKDAEPNRFAIMVLSNCKNLEACSKSTLMELGFVPHPEKAYRYYRKFSNAARKLIEESIEYFEAPCCKLFERLEQQGFKGDQVTYP